MDYFYPKASGEYRWHIQQKCVQAIGRQPRAMMDTGDDKTMLRFDPPLAAGEKAEIDAIFSDPATVCDAPAIAIAGNSYLLKDIWECRAELEAAIGFPIVFWFPKSEPGDERPNRIRLDFAGRILTQQDKKAVEDAIKDLFIEWV